MANAVRLTIDLSDLRAPVPAGLYGIFMEEINHGFDGGIYAELVQNRSFEEGILPPGMKLVKDEEGNLRMELESLPDGVPEERWPMPWPWNMNCGWNPERALVGWSLRDPGESGALMELTKEHPMNEASARSLRISIPAAAVGKPISLINSGYWGMNLQEGSAYDLKFHLRPYDFKGKIVVTLESPDGEVLATKRIGKIRKSNNWKRYAAKIKPTRSHPQAQLAITFTGRGSLQIDWVSLFPPTFRDKPNGLRKDLAGYLADLKPDFIRYPGGCYVEGLSWESAPDWRKMVCPPEERPGMWGYWQYRSTDGFGYHEFLEFCEELGADGMYVAFAGMTVHPDNNWPLDNLDTIIRQTLDAIEYAIGPPDSPWGSQRARMGHPDPFPLRYVEIGNEHYAEIYGEYYLRFREAIKAKYPDMTVIMSMYWSGLNRPVIELAGDENIDMVDEHAYRDAQWIRRRFDYFDRYERTPWKVYVGEYASHRGQGDLLCALSDAVYLMMMEKNGDLVTMASYAPLFCNVNDRSWGVNLIEFDASRSFAHSSYYVQKLFNEYRPERNIGVSVQQPGFEPDSGQVPLAATGEPGLFFSVAGYDSVKQQVVVKVVNYNPGPVKTRILLAGIRSVDRVGQHFIIRSDDLSHENSLENPHFIQPVEKMLENCSPDFTVEVPGYSVNVLVVGAEKR
ncbi:MAG: alpha-L-arabinofuranosidase C-terminal domain-containing protein [Bacteroidales bacterium]